MIFFMVMPALIGGFGKIKVLNYNLKYSSLSAPASSGSDFVQKSSSSLAPYLAGLIEADGSIAVHDPNSKTRIYRPKFIIVFSLADKPLAEKLAQLTQAGKVYLKENAGCVL
jgi:hypothetical protein